MKNESISTVLFLSIILNFSCTKDNILEPKLIKTEGMIPLKVGFKWTWNVINYNEDGSIQQSYPYFTEVTKDTIINGENWFILREKDSSITSIMTNREGVSYSYNSGQPRISFNTIIEDTSVSSTNSNGSYLVSKNNIIQGPLGEFNCNLYHVFINVDERKLLVTNYYLENNKGIIRTESFSHKTDGSSYMAVITELISTNAF
jgi:hypothetical protein